MRVLFVVNTLPDTDISGVGEQVVQLAAGLEAEGHEVRVLGRGPAGARGPKLLFPLTVVPAFLRLRSQFRPHVVQVHESDGAIVAWLVRVLQAVSEPSPILVALQQVSYLEEIRAVRALRADGRVLGRPGLTEWVFRWFKAPLQVVFGVLTASFADRILAPSRRTALEIERDYGVEGVLVLPNVTGARAGHGDDPEPSEGEDGYLLFVGRLRVRKGLEVLLHALHRLRNRLPGQRLLVVGEGEHRTRLERTAEQLDLGGIVEFMGACEPQRVPRLMARARALVVPSIYEGMPLVILEAMSAGLPVVASRVSGIPEVVLDGVTGWLVPPEDVEALIEVLEMIERDPGEATRRGLEGRARVVAGATPATAARQWLHMVTHDLPIEEVEWDERY